DPVHAWSPLDASSRTGDLFSSSSELPLDTERPSRTASSGYGRLPHRSGKGTRALPMVLGRDDITTEISTSRNHAKRQIKHISFGFGSFRWGISPILLKTLRPPPRLPHPEQRTSNGAHPHRPRSSPRTTFPLPPPQQQRVFPKGGKRPSRPADAAHPMPHTHLDDDQASPVCPAQIVQLHEPMSALGQDELWDQLREQHGPVVPVELEPGVRAWLLLGYQESLGVLQSPHMFSRDTRRWRAV